MVVKRVVLWFFVVGVVVVVGYVGWKFGFENVILRFYCLVIKFGW